LPRRPAAATYSGRWQVFPLEQQRKLGIRDKDGKLVRFPYLHPVSDRNGPRAWSPAQKLEFLLGMSLDGFYEIM